MVADRGYAGSTRRPTLADEVHTTESVEQLALVAQSQLYLGCSPSAVRQLFLSEAAESSDMEIACARDESSEIHEAKLPAYRHAGNCALFLKQEP
ncbi:hypothetical protein [Rhizobium sp. BR 249]|uniref:hypothetical protein n=1 Tax=Rhizobium sp. BR 249 TaxID=3040011 RepID=UPI0039BFFEDE